MGDIVPVLRRDPESRKSDQKKEVERKNRGAGSRIDFVWRSLCRAAAATLPEKRCVFRNYSSLFYGSAEIMV